MLQVEIYAYENTLSSGDVKKVVRGTVTLNDKGKLVVKAVSPQYNTFFKNLLAQPISPLTDDGFKVYNPRTDPKGWIENLHLELKSYACMASEAKNV